MARWAACLALMMTSAACGGSDKGRYGCVELIDKLTECGSEVQSTVNECEESYYAFPSPCRQAFNEFVECVVSATCSDLASTRVCEAEQDAVDTLCAGIALRPSMTPNPENGNGTTGDRTSKQSVLRKLTRDRGRLRLHSAIEPGA